MSAFLFFKKASYAIIGAMLIAPPLLAGGSLGYDDLQEKFPDHAALFSGLEQIVDFSNGAFANIRIMSKVETSEQEERWNNTFAALRLGPYYACAREKKGERRVVKVTFTTEFYFLDKDGNQLDAPEVEAVDFRETLTGIAIVPVEKNAQKDDLHDCSYLYEKTP